MNEKSPRVGFVGLGVMGRPMAARLLAAGYPVVVHDLNPGPVENLVALGATVRPSAREVADASDIFITMLPDSPDVESVYLGPDGAFAVLRHALLAIDMSSIAPRVSRMLADRAVEVGAEMLDAPVSGGDKGAIDGTLSIMVGGSISAYERARPILEVFGKTIVHVGPAGAGQIVKVCNQVVVAIVIEAVAEALVLGAKAGVDAASIVDVLQGGLAHTRVLELRRTNFLEGRFDPGFRTRLHLKDLRNALDLARETRVPLPATAQVEQLMVAMTVAEHGDFDHSGLITVIEELAAFRIAVGAG